METESVQKDEKRPIERRDRAGKKKPGFGAIASLIAAISAGLLAIAVFQAQAPEDDFQMANLKSIAVAAAVGLFALVQTQRIAKSRGHRWFLPITMLAAIVAISVTYRWVGFSGEMIPQFENRFKSVEAAQQRSDDVSSVSSDVPTEASRALHDSGGFLGPNRNGRIEQRSFEVPASGTTPEKLWEVGIGKGWSSFAVNADRAVTLEQRDEEEWLTCYRLFDGKLMWSQRHRGRHANALGGVGPRSTPTISEGRVYAQSAIGFVWCVDLDSGTVHWTADLLKKGGWSQEDSESAAPWGRAGSPLLAGNLCILPLGSPNLQDNSSHRSLIALDAETGSEVWRSGTDQISYASPSLMNLAGKTQIVSVNEKTVTGHDVDHGTELWSFPWPGQTNGGANCASAIQVDEHRFVVGKGYGGGSALIEVTQSDENFAAKEAWVSSSVLKTKFTHACINEDLAFAISNGILEVVSIKDAVSLWSQPRRDRAGAGHVLLVEDTLVVQNESGEISMVDAKSDKYHELCRFDALGSKTWNIPTVAGRHLLIRNDKQAICYLLAERLIKGDP